MILNIYLLVLLFIAFGENHCLCFLLCIGPSFRLYYTLPPVYSPHSCDPAALTYLTHLFLVLYVNTSLI